MNYIDVPIDLIVLQATPFCNIDCKYCYLPNRNTKGSFDLALVPILFNRLIETKRLRNQLTISWHAGEPLVLGYNYFKEAFRIIEDNCPSKITIKHSIQTNGILITQELCDLFKEYNVEIGVSIDGPKFINDLNRVNRKNKSTFDQAFKGINLLNKNDISFSSICVLSKSSLQYPKQIFQFFKSIKTKSVGFNIEEIEGINKSSSIDLMSDVSIYIDFLNTFYDLLETDPVFEQRELKKYTHSILFKKEIGNGLVQPLNTITIDKEGNFTPFSPELLSTNDRYYDNFKIGNIKTDSFLKLNESEKFNLIFSDISTGVEMCKQSCEYFEVCGGGAPSNKLHENGTFKSTETLYCKFNVKLVNEVILERIENNLLINKN